MKPGFSWQVIFGGRFVFNEGKLVILLNGFQKKTQKTPTKEIEKAARLMDEYYAGKEVQEGKKKKK